MKRKIKFASLPPTTRLQIIDLNDYMEPGQPFASAHITKDAFTKQHLDNGAMGIDDWYRSSGDGSSNIVLVTIINNCIYTVV